MTPQPPENADTPSPTPTEDALSVTIKSPRRPARGYHKFRNGMLNVAPKDDEKAM
jgi:hypothetical protein